MDPIQFQAFLLSLTADKDPKTVQQLIDQLSPLFSPIQFSQVAAHVQTINAQRVTLATTGVASSGTGTVDGQSSAGEPERRGVATGFDHGELSDANDSLSAQAAAGGIEKIGEKPGENKASEDKKTVTGASALAQMQKLRDDRMKLPPVFIPFDQTIPGVDKPVTVTPQAPQYDQKTRTIAGSGEVLQNPTGPAVAIPTTSGQGMGWAPGGALLAKIPGTSSTVGSLSNWAVEQIKSGKLDPKIFGYAKGGVINEPVVGKGMKTGNTYLIGEEGPERVTPIKKKSSKRLVRRADGKMIEV